MRKVHHYYLQSVYRNGRVPSCWLSIGVMYYIVDQPRDSIDGLSRAIRLNPILWEAWYNIGVLVSFDVLRPLGRLLINQYISQYDYVGQTSDAFDAFQRCAELNPQCNRAVQRSSVLEELLSLGVSRSDSMIAEMVEPPLDHVSHTLPERHSNLPIVLNPIEANDRDHVHDNDQCEEDSDVSAESDWTDWSGDDDEYRNADHDASRDSDCPESNN